MTKTELRVAALRLSVERRSSNTIKDAREYLAFLMEDYVEPKGAVESVGGQQGTQGKRK